MSREVVSAIPAVQRHYEDCIRNGCSPALADMLAHRTFPGVRGTDRSFMQGRHLDGSQFEGSPDIVGKEYVKKALAAGVNPAGKYYSGPLARYPGDPRAWVDGVSDIKRIAEERNLSVQGSFARESVAIDPPRGAAGPYRVADDIVDQHVAARLAEDPALAGRADDVRQEVREQLSGIRGRG